MSSCYFATVVELPNKFKAYHSCLPFICASKIRHLSLAASHTWHPWMSLVLLESLGSIRPPDTTKSCFASSHREVTLKFRKIIFEEQPSLSGPLDYSTTWVFDHCNQAARVPKSDSTRLSASASSIQSNHWEWMGIDVACLFLIFPLRKQSKKSQIGSFGQSWALW